MPSFATSVRWKMWGEAQPMVGITHASPTFFPGGYIDIQFFTFPARAVSNVCVKRCPGLKNSGLCKDVSLAGSSHLCSWWAATFSIVCSTSLPQSLQVALGIPGVWACRTSREIPAWHLILLPPSFSSSDSQDAASSHCCSRLWYKSLGLDLRLIECVTSDYSFTLLFLNQIAIPPFSLFSG